MIEVNVAGYRLSENTENTFALRTLMSLLKAKEFNELDGLQFEIPDGVYTIETVESVVESAMDNLEGIVIKKASD